MHYCNYRPNYEISLQMRAKCEPSASQCKSDVRQMCARCAPDVSHVRVKRESSASQVCAMCAPNASHTQVNESRMKAEQTVMRINHLLGHEPRYLVDGLCWPR